MLLKRTLLLALFVIAVLSCAAAQEDGGRSQLEENLQSRYRLTILGGGFMGVRGENSIRRTGGTVVLMRDGFYGSYNRGKIAANAVQNGKTNVATGDKDVALARGEKFYVTAVHVGSDLVTLGLLSTRMIPSGSKTAQAWCTANFFFDKQVLDQGDIGKVDSVIDQWLLPEGSASAPPPATASAAMPATPAPAPTSVPHSNSVELKPGMTHEQVVNELGAPLQDASFGEHRWLTYSGITVVLEQGKLTSAERNAQALVPVRISSDPGGADVMLDGKFVSQTPAVLRLHAGPYKIAVKMSGYTNWEREITILLGAEVTLSAKLDKQ
jgi:hypothetical protein